MSIKYNHACDLAFEIVSSDIEGEDITPSMYRLALMRRVEELDRTNTWNEAIGIFDTMEEGT